MDMSHDVVHSKFFYVLITLISYFIASPFLTGNLISNFLLSAIFSVFVIVCINASTENRLLYISTIVFGVLSLVSYWDKTFFGISSLFKVHHYLVNIIFMSLICYAVLTRVASQKNVTGDTMFGAISGYFLIGLAWTFIYLTINTMSQNAFTNNVPFASEHELEQHFVYYSFVTLATVGYGDIVAVSDVARTFSWLEAVVGQIYLAVWISQLVGLRIASRTRH